MAVAAGSAFHLSARALSSIAGGRFFAKSPHLGTSRFAFRSRNGSLNFRADGFQSGFNAFSVKQITRVFCGDSFKDLASKKCVPCDQKDLRPMLEESAQKLLSKVEGWAIANEVGILKLKKSWKVKSFIKGLDFFQHVADVAEAEGHHPDLHLIGWNNVKIEIFTHSVGGLTENDFILAAKIDGLNLEHLLRKTVPKLAL